MYATKNSGPFGGQRASLSRSVILHGAEDDPIEPGVITQIDPLENEQITITSSFNGVDHVGLTFVETKTEADVEALPAQSWTWPVRV